MAPASPPRRLRRKAWPSAGPTTAAPRPAQPPQSKASEKAAKKEKPPKKGADTVVAKKPIKTVEEAFKAADRDYRVPHAGPKFIIKQAGKVFS